MVLYLGCFTLEGCCQREGGTFFMDDGAIVQVQFGDDPVQLPVFLIAAVKAEVEPYELEEEQSSCDAQGEADHVHRGIEPLF